ncbi:hypothetical protein [Stappia sp. ES.058]|nr:hypothetical protein [Stappia sp. ES.058]SDT93273.1 hypothetical protein SAMN05428979_0514 [Stappia sp. ES.058]
MTSKSPQSAPATPRPNLDALYKPVGINAINAAALCNKATVKTAGGSGK